MNFFAPGSGAKYAVPIIGDFTLIPSLSSDLFNTVLFGDTTADVLAGSIVLEAFETLIFFVRLDTLALSKRIPLSDQLIPLLIFYLFSLSKNLFIALIAITYPSGPKPHITPLASLLIREMCLKSSLL